MANETLIKALAAFQKELPTVAKTQEGYKYKYADLTDVTAAIMPILGKHGLVFISRPDLEFEKPVLRYSLMHTSGECIDGTYPLLGNITDPQILGGAITYARRYALCAVTGVAPGGDDDDASKASAAANAPGLPLGWRESVAGFQTVAHAERALEQAKKGGWLTVEVQKVIEKKINSLRAGGNVAE